MTKDERTASKGVGLQHRHFAFIAAVMKAQKADAMVAPISHAHWHHTVQAFASACAASNRRFDRTRFLVACGALEAD